MDGWMWSGEDRDARDGAPGPAPARASASLPPAGPPHVRVSDHEREQVAARLREAAGRGELTLDEVGERQAAAYAAVTRGDLVPLTADLPARPEPIPETTPATQLREWLAAIHPAAWVVALVALVGLAAVLAVDLSGGHASFPWFILWIPVALVLRARHRYHHDHHDHHQTPTL